MAQTFKEYLIEVQTKGQEDPEVADDQQETVEDSDDSAPQQ